MSTKVAYLVHDLNDASVHRRVEALRHGGAAPQVAGFYRREAVSRVAGEPARPLGRTRDAGFGERIALVLSRLVGSRLLRRSLLRGVTADASVILARNLEMLLLAAAVRRPGQRLAFECLDIHRLMLRRDPAGRALRWLERRLLARTDLVLVSSPAYAREYFRAMQHYEGDVLLVENKVLSARACAAPPAVGAQETSRPAGGEPWRIGWFGMLRCARSLDLLCDLAAKSEGRIEVLIAGKPSPAVFPDFEARTARAPGVSFIGPYVPAELARLYRSIHFAWCIDYFEEGLNSSWLLPNRLYESIANGAVPVALEGVETGRWLADAAIGLRLPAGEAIGAELGAMTAARFAALESAVARFPEGRVAFGPGDYRELVRRLGEPA